MLRDSFGASEQPVTIKDIEINKKLIDLLKLTRIIFKPKGTVFILEPIIPFFLIKIINVMLF
jgi:hypothetical protein